MKKNTSTRVAMFVVATVLATIAAVGPSRVAVGAQCFAWHATNGPRLTAGAGVLTLPRNWCPGRATQTSVSLLRVPDSRAGDVVAVAVGGILEHESEPESPPPTRRVGGHVTPVDGAPHLIDIGGLRAFRSTYTANPGTSKDALRSILIVVPDARFTLYAHEVAREDRDKIDELLVSLSW